MTARRPREEKVGIVRNQADILKTSSELLEVLKSELTAHGIEPTDENLSWVLSIIQQSLKPSLSKLFIE